MRDSEAVPAKPRLRHCTMLDLGRGRPLRLIVGQDHFDLTEEIGERADFLRLKSLLDGRHSLDEICRRTALSRPVVEEVVSALSRAGLLRRATPCDVIAASAFHDRLVATLLMWRRQIGYHRLFSELAAGSARYEVLQGLFIESYHVVQSAAHHIAVALAHASGERERALLITYLRDEADHASMLLETCVRLGLPAGAVVSSQPTVGTSSLVGMLSEIGRRDTLAYFAALALFEALPDEVGEGEAAAAALSKQYGLSEDVLEPAMAHMRIDVGAAHNSLLEQALEGRESIAAERVHAIVNHLHDLKHAYDQHHDQIRQYYSDVSNYIPRLKVDYFSL